MDPEVANAVIDEMHRLNARISHLENVLDPFKKMFSGTPKTGDVAKMLETFPGEWKVHDNVFTLQGKDVTVTWEANKTFTITNAGKTYEAKDINDLKRQLHSLLEVLTPVKAPANLRAFTAAVLRQQARAQG